MDQASILDYLLTEIQAHAEILHKGLIPVTENSDLFKVLDSLARLEIMFEIEDKYFQDIDNMVDINTYKQVTIAELAQLIYEQVQ